jgi:hypothetical protein
MKRIKNLDVRGVRTQGIVPDDGTIHMSITSFRPVASRRMTRAGLLLNATGFSSRFGF